METDIRIARVPDGQIDFDDDTYSLSPAIEDTISPALLESIKRVGILHPPILKEYDVRSFKVVAGRQRLRAAYEILAMSTVPCVIIPQHIPEHVVLAYGLEEILTQRHPTPVEKAIFLRKALQWLEEKDVAEQFLPLLGLKPHPYHIQHYLKLIRLEDPIILALHEGWLDESVTRELIILPFPDRMALFDLIDVLRLSVSNQKKLVLICRELAMRSNTSILAVLSDPALREIIHHPQANVPQKAANLMNWLQNLRSPRLVQAELEFREFITGLKLPSNITVTPTQSFEKDELIVSITLQDRENLETFLEKFL